MKYLKGRILASFMAFTLAFAPLSVYADETATVPEVPAQPIQENEEESQADMAGYLLSIFMEQIMANYAGDPVTYEELYFAAINGMTELLDQYSYFMTDEEFDALDSSMDVTALRFGILYDQNEKGALYIAEFEQGSTGPALGLKIGDILVSINGVNIEKMTVLEVLNTLHSAQGNTVRAGYRRDGKEFVVEITKQIIENKTVAVYKIEDIYSNVEKNVYDDTRIISMSMVGEGTADELAAAVTKLQDQGVKNIILDLRGNPGGYVYKAIAVCEILATKGVIITYAEANKSDTTFYSALEKRPFDEIVVLTDPDTASAAELIASCLQDDGCKVIGQKSYGKGVIQTVYPLLGGGYMKLTTAKSIRRSGQPINGIGIIPNIPVDIPDYLYETEDTTDEDIILMKKILKFCGFEVGTLDKHLDNKTNKAIKEFKVLMGLSSNTQINKEFKTKLNDAFYALRLSTDVTLEAALEYLESK